MFHMIRIYEIESAADWLDATLHETDKSQPQGTSRC